MSFIRLIILISVFITSLISSENLEKVTLQLNWKYQFEFAGFIVAKEKGFYKEKGLDVEVKEFEFGLNVLDDVKSAKATFGVYDLSILELYDEKKPIKLIANYFKRSALVFVTTQDIITPEDLRNKIIMADKEQLKSSTLSTLFKKFKIKEEDYTFIQHNFDSKDFIDGKVDVMSAYVSNEIYHLRKSKKPFNIIDPLTYGIYGSGVNIFTSEEETINNPQRVKDFIEATNKGWVYALENKEEVSELIYNKYSKKKSIEALLFEAEQTQKLIIPEIYNIGEINRTLIQKNVNEFASEGFIKEKFDIDSIIFDFEKKDEYKLLFTKEQKEYIKNKKEITMCVDPDWMPYEKLDENGKHIGMTSDYIPLLSNKIGIPINLIQTKDWTESIEYAKQRKCDIFSLAMPTPSRLKYMNFTMPYISFPLVIATKMDKLFISNPESLVTKEKIGIVKGYAIGEILKKRYPNHKIVDVENVDSGMQMVIKGELFGFLDALPTVGYSLQHKYISELKIAGKLENNLELGIAVRNDDPVLFELFQKAVQSIDELKKQEILNKYISVKVESAFDYKLLYQVLFVVFIIALVAFYRHGQVLNYNRKLERKQKQLNESNEELMLTKKKLEASISDFEILLDSVIEAIFVFEERICIDVNDIAIEMYGYNSKDEVIGKHVQDLVTKESYSQILEKTASGDTTPYELVAVRKNGEPFDIIARESNVIINSKEVRISAIVDVSEMKNKEQLLFQQSKMASMGQMLENIAHQWRQPLSLISSISTALEVKKSVGITTLEEELGDLKKINNTAQHLSQTIEDFRNFFKGDKVKTKFSVLSSIEKNFSLLEGMLKNNNIEVVYENKDDIEIENLENEFTQALINIFYNSKDVMEVLSEHKYIFVSLKKEENFICIRIKDSGGGIPENIIGNVFEPYFTTKHKSQGTGIGLYMTHLIVEKHMNGTIAVKNKSYTYNNENLKGAQFTIKLPI